MSEKNPAKPLIELTTFGSEVSRGVRANTLASLISLSPFVTEVTYQDGTSENVAHSLFDILVKLQESDSPVFTSLVNIPRDLKRLVDLDQFRAKRTR